MSLQVIQVGLGPIGLGVAARMAARPDIELVAAVDPDPQKVGRPLSEILKDNPGTKGIAPHEVGEIQVSPNLAAALATLERRPDVAVHTTSSFLSTVTSQLVELADAGLNVVSTSEELSYPWWHHPEEARQIDQAAVRAGVTIHGTGVNPGFVMDLLPVCLTGVTETVERVEVHRVVDAGTRRGPLQLKVGAGISPSEFEERKATGRFGHIGLVESVALIGAGLGWRLTRIETELAPKVAESETRTQTALIQPGRVLGINQVAVGFDAGGTERIHLHLEMYVGAPEPKDEIRVLGSPNLRFSAPTGVPGDNATVAAVVNALARVRGAAPGLKSVLDLPIPRWSCADPVS